MSTAEHNPAPRRRESVPAWLPSRGIARRQSDRHPDLAPADYRRPQRTMDEGEVIQDRDESLIFMQLDARWWLREHVSWVAESAYGCLELGG